MARIHKCIFLITLLQIAQGAELMGRSLRAGDRANQNTNESGEVVFPGQIPDIVKRNAMKLVIPEDCRKIGICDDVPNYPDELVSQLISQLKRANRTTFNMDVLEIPTIAQRISPEDETMPLCDSYEKTFSPQAALDSNKKWHYILNVKDNPIQKFRVEICRSPDLACSSVAYFQNGYEARCVQKYVYRNMVGVNENKEIVEGPFQVPSCCSCLVRNVAN
ncbi:protein spaetzle-like isoform X2 [Danaus plexippus]|uniref:protein spaetzle-like isoform X2 n=1 Tax=Danaus plexippus TaxID=13037 RepID=UPI0013C41E75|nr:protein spaetzle-like isoform X2 [Danaus plexippus]